MEAYCCFPKSVRCLVVLNAFFLELWSTHLAKKLFFFKVKPVEDVQFQLGLEGGVYLCTRAASWALSALGLSGVAVMTTHSGKKS